MIVREFAANVAISLPGDRGPIVPGVLLPVR